jgi:6,7-dimethyl-8-ribityllumazine synthase
MPCGRANWRGEKYDAIVALAQYPADTPHFDYVAGEMARGLAQVAAESDAGGFRRAHDEYGREAWTVRA